MTNSTPNTIYCFECEAQIEAPNTELPDGWGWILIDGEAYYGCPDHKNWYSQAQEIKGIGVERDLIRLPVFYLKDGTIKKGD